ncbi:hypothetical protein GGI12_001773 [Dipsacomyces acuminosporus]|nr:hypothetical protein GGI12_001773 [Dipsacomyces acuminosporus]
MVLLQIPWLEYIEQLDAFIAQIGLAKAQVPWLGYAEALKALIEEAGYAKVLATGAAAYAAYKIIYALYLSPLRNIPGPFLARLTNKRAEYFGAVGAQARLAREEYEQYGDVYMYQPNAVVISNPDDIRTVLATHKFLKTDFYKTIDLLGEQVIVSARDPQIAGIRRRQIGPYFTHLYLAKMEGDILEHGYLSIKQRWDKMLKASSNGQIEVNYHRVFHYATFDIIGKLVFGKDFGAIKNDNTIVEEWRSKSLAYFGMRAFFPIFKYPPFSLLLKPLERVYNDFVSHGAKSIEERKALLASLERIGRLDKKPHDLLQGFISTEDPESKIKMSQNEAHAETLDMLIAGSDTTSNTLLWTVHLLMLHPACFKKAVEEVRSAFDKDHVITYDEARAQLPYLEACIYESMRHTPVSGGLIPRLVPKEGVALSGHYIPGGTEVNINIAGASYNKKHWKNPYQYDPTRFLDNEQAKKSLLTFSSGVRACPGKYLAWIELFTILANILKDYDLRLPDDYTLHGPSILNDKGCPKIMEINHFLTSAPAYPERDCRATVSKA